MLMSAAEAGFRAAATGAVLRGRSAGFVVMVVPLTSEAQMKGFRGEARAPAGNSGVWHGTAGFQCASNQLNSNLRLALDRPIARWNGSGPFAREEWLL